MSIDAFAKICPSCRGRLEKDVDTLFVDLSATVRGVTAIDAADLTTKTLNHINERVNTIGPKLVVLATDGTVPLARLTRRRRQNHLETMYKEEDEGEPVTFGAMSAAGTKFMADLLVKTCEQAKERNHSIKILPPSTAGEATCKISNCIAKADDGELNCVLGVTSLEAFVTPSLEKKKVVFRMNDSEDCVDLKVLREEFVLHVNGRCHGSLQATSCLRDVCFLSTWNSVGPLPRGCSVEKSTTAFSDAVRMCKENNLLEKGGGLNKKLLSAVLYQLTKNSTKHRDACSRHKPEATRTVRVSTNDDKWRQKYWKLFFNIDPNCDGKKKPIVKGYLTGLVWHLGYLHGNVTDWQWYYDHDAAPPLDDLVSHLDCLDTFQSVKNRPVKPLECLALAVDRANLGLLPKGYIETVERITSNLSHLYPVEVETVMLDDEAIPRLPSIELNTILQAMKSLKLTSAEKERNKLDR